MALSVSTVWEVRTTGNALNGGGVNPATVVVDYSQQDAAQLAITDLEADGESCEVHSETGGFTPAMVGNLIYISSYTGSWNVGFYEIVDYLSLHGVTLDRNPTFLEVCSGGVARVGGAQSHIGLVCAAVPAASAAGANVVHVKAGTYVRGTHFTNQVVFYNSGNYLNHHVVRGYNATRGDAIAPCVTLNGNNAAYDVYYSDRAFIRLENIEVNGYAGGTPTNAKHGFNLASGSDGSSLYRCRSANTGSQGIRAASAGCLIEGCEVTGFGRVAASLGINVTGILGSMVGCYVHDGAGDAFNISATYPGLLAYCIGSGCTQYGLNMNYNGLYPQGVVHCVFHGNGSHGIYTGGTTFGRPVQIVNTILSNNGGYGIAAHGTGKGRAILRGVAFYGNSSGQIDANTTVDESVARITLTSDPFVDAANRDFRLAGQAWYGQGHGWPGPFLVSGALTEWQGEPLLGAVQEMVWSAGTDNPYQPVVDALWAILEAYPEFVAAVRPGNRVKFCGTGASRSPIKTEISTADLPEVRIVLTGSRPGSHASSSGYEETVTFEVQVSSGDQRLDAGHLDLRWMVFQAMFNLESRLRDLVVWSGDKIVKTAKATGTRDGFAQADLNRGIVGWTALWACEVGIWFQRAMLTR